MLKLMEEKIRISANQSLLFFELMKLNLEMYEIIIIVFFQVGISDTSKYSTWKEKNKEPIRGGDYFCPIRELYFEI